MYRQESNHGTGTKTRARKSTTTEYGYYFTGTYSVLLGRRRHNIHSKAKEWPPPKTRVADGVRRPYVAWSLDDRMGPRDRSGLPAPSWCDDGQVATSASHGRQVSRARLRPCQGEVIRAPAGNAVERNERVYQRSLSVGAR